MRNECQSIAGRLELYRVYEHITIEDMDISDGDLNTLENLKMRVNVHIQTKKLKLTFSSKTG